MALPGEASAGKVQGCGVFSAAMDFGQQSLVIWRFQRREAASKGKFRYSKADR
ncbi:MAG: hypothetical protein QNJ46_24005 [Leptolyngbyaceae cyanobacterium MO_188.B28]|nr:hypothetical protein [Leptolyngbyaceae cyanobacterium MO_188.B28]